METTALMNGVQLATITGVTDDDAVTIRLADGQTVAATPVQAVSIDQCRAAVEAEAPAVVVMDPRDDRHAIILGLLLAAPPVPFPAALAGVRVCVDGDEQVRIACGKASITLASSGKVVIRGTDILSRSAGANRIKGGSVQIN